MVNQQPWLNIQGTSLQFNLIYAENGGTTPLNHPLIGNQNLTPLVNEIGLVLAGGSISFRNDDRKAAPAQ
jgi:hypothetical protein